MGTRKKNEEEEQRRWEAGYGKGVEGRQRREGREKGTYRTDTA